MMSRGLTEQMLGRPSVKTFLSYLFLIVRKVNTLVHISGKVVIFHGGKIIFNADLVQNSCCPVLRGDDVLNRVMKYGFNYGILVHCSGKPHSNTFSHKTIMHSAKKINTD